MKNIIRSYVAVGIGTFITSVVVLVRDGKDSPSKIAYCATVNGLMWPGLVVAELSKKR